jgi:UPF0755 protein
MEDKTGVFKSVKSDSEDLREEATLASILAKRKVEIDKTTVMRAVKPDETPASAGAYNPFAPENLTQSIDISRDSDEPFEVRGTVMDKSREKRKRDIAREQKIRRLKSEQSLKTFAHIFGSVLLIVFIISVSVFFSYNIIRAAIDFTGITINEFEVEVYIPANATTEEIAEILSDKGLIGAPEFFVLYSQLFGHDGKYLSGLFLLDSSMSYGSLITALQNDFTQETVMVTLREGLTAEEVGLLLEEYHVCRAEDFELYYREIRSIFNFEKRVDPNPMKFHQLEGYLFPDTYEFFVVPSLRDGRYNELTEREREIVADYARLAANKIFAQFNEMITPVMYKTMGEMGFTLDEVITLASMIQSEAAFEEDKLLVASVFLNRLADPGRFPRLQSDPTTYYARDFILPHTNPGNIGVYQPIMDAYDTYITDGLPPGPINNPGIAAIMAVLDAPKTNYYYFCANIETKEVFYAADLATHEANLAKVAEQMGLNP